jgi:hypothetical protein
MYLKNFLENHRFDLLIEMVKLHVKRGDDSQFLYETTTDTSVEDALKSICNIYNGRLKISRLCSGL